MLHALADDVSQDSPLLSVSEVYPGGSYGKGTSIGEESDVDLLLVLNGIPITNHVRWLHFLLATVRTIMEEKFPGWFL